ncbi:MAG: enoyl-CoA hydratase-related protein [Candidatus Thermoplasmatota archaeon]|nr:enoyl-CoA hydratase-related protein [Candidatus Thermoplasmatota archaeon]
MKYNTIETRREKNVVTVALNRPDVHNAMNEQLMKELTLIFKELNNDENVRAVVLTGNGKSFCSGADLNWMKSMISYSKEENIKDSKLLLDLFESIYNCDKPVIGRINGAAFGGGLGLIAVCDLSVALPDLKFAFSEVKLGLIPAVISTFVVKRIGIANMKRLFITGERFDSNHAKEIGLVDYVVPENEFDLTVKKYVELVCSSGPNAVKEIKKLTNNYENLDEKNYKKFTVEKIAELRVSDEGQEGVSAFLEKRKPRWGC